MHYFGMFFMNIKLKGRKTTNLATVNNFELTKKVPISKFDCTSKQFLENIPTSCVQRYCYDPIVTLNFMQITFVYFEFYLTNIVRKILQNLYQNRATGLTLCEKKR